MTAADIVVWGSACLGAVLTFAGAMAVHLHQEFKQGQRELACYYQRSFA